MTFSQEVMQVSVNDLEKNPKNALGKKFHERQKRRCNKCHYSKTHKCNHMKRSLKMCSVRQEQAYPEKSPKYIELPLPPLPANRHKTKPDLILRREC